MKRNITNWGNYPVENADEYQPAFRDQLQALAAEKKDWIPRGNGRCYGDASLAPTVITTTKLNRFISFDTLNGILDCESGVTLDQVLEVIVPKGWFLPVTPGTKLITIGGAVGSDVHGKNHHVDGSFSNHIVDMDVILPGGELIVCSPDAHADLFWATCGGMGLTGLISRVKFHLKKIETSYIRQKQIKAANLDEIIRLFEEYKDYTYSVAWIDCLKKGKGFGRSILMLGEHAQLSDLTPAQQQQPLKVVNKTLFRFPMYLPSIFLNKLSIGIFNFLFYRKNTRKEINNVVPYEPFFYPLDVIDEWNKMYGRKGFVQYQFVLPLNQKEGLANILHRITERGFASFLAVLKVFGKQDTMIGFPMEGFTLALDIPIRNGLFEFLDEMDKLVLEYGGRIYLSKDARMKAHTFQQSYPRLQEFKQTIQKYNGQQVVHSLLSDRLQLTPQ
ncbi:MAG: FAD-binding oxidoreductase [Chitinophagaceae bacterium]|nr:FAD-binding oxidoreductase [Chitinophagaceae bacterium]